MNARKLHQIVDGPAMRDPQPRGASPHGRDRGRVSRVLIVALDAVIPAELSHANVLVVAPALKSRLRHWLSDEDAARRRAKERATAFVDWLERIGVQAKGQVGDDDPLLAIADALPTFPADEIMIAAQPEGSNRFVDELVSRAPATASRCPFPAPANRSQGPRSARSMQTTVALVASPSGRPRHITRAYHQPRRGTRREYPRRRGVLV
jgi:hypothetical protein